MDVFNFKCKFCGGELVQVDGLKSVGKCKYCGSKQTLPKLENEKRANLFARANHLRRNNEFDKAEALYEQLLNEDLSDPEAYWSLVLCRYGIEYVEDKRTGNRIPTVNRMQMTSILSDEDYKSAIANADDEQRKLYEEEAKLINEIQKGIMEIARKEEPFDIFICYKETDSEGRRSRDSILAQDLYHELTRDGYKVFFARVTLQGKLGSAYEPYIFSALNSSKVMVVLGTQKEHFEAIWVRNEWSRFLGQIKKGERKVLIPAYRDMDAYDLPVEFSNLQALDMSRLGFLQELVEGVENILKSYKKKEEPVREPVHASAPTAAPAPAPTPTKKKSKAVPIIIVSLLLAIAIGAAAVFGGGMLDSLFGGETEVTTRPLTEDPTEEKTEAPTQQQTEHETEDDIEDSETETGNGTEGIVGSELEVEDAVTVIEEGQAYLGVLAHKNLGKLVYLTGTMYNEYYLAETDDIDSAANVYFEKAPDINYYMYFLEGTLKAYVNITPDGSYLDISIDTTPKTAWHYNETYKCLMANVNGELVFLGTSDTGTYDNICVKRISEGETFFKMQFIVSPDQSVEPPVSEESLEFETNEFGDEYTVIGLGTVKGTSVVIPDTYNGKPVTAIGDGAFEGSALTDVTISNSVRFIGNRAFANTKLVRVTIPDSVTEVGAEVFAECASLSSVEMGEGLTYISEAMYKKCAKLTRADIPSNVTYIATEAFAESGITSVTIPDSVTTIVYGAFMDCTNLREITLGVGVTQIENAVFSGCENLSSVTYAGSLEEFNNISIGESNAFFTRIDVDCLTESEVVVKNAVTVIEEGQAYLGVLAHKNLGKLVYLTGTMYNEYYLAETDDKNSAAKVYFEEASDINYYMYFLEGNLKAYVNITPDGSYLDISIDTTPKTAWYYNETYKCLMANVNGELVFLGTSDTGTYDNICVKRINEGLSYFKIELIKADTTGGSSSEGTTQLSYQLASDGNSYIVTGAISLSGANLEIPATYNGKPVRCIAAGAFRNNTTITSVKIPRSIVAIGDGAFEGVSNLKTFCYEGFDEEWAEIYYPTREQEINENVYFDCLASTHLVKPDTKDFYFVYDSDGLSFYVSGIRELADIDYNTIAIPSTYKGLPVIGICDYAFSGDDQIKTVFIPDSIKNIGVGAFDNVWRLTRVLYGGNSTEWDMIAIGEGNEALNTDQNHFNVTVDGEWTLIGDIEGTSWSVDFMMTQKGTNVWLSDYLTLDAGNELKVRMNGEWVIDFGMTLGGENYVVKESGVYQIKFVYDPVRMTGEITLVPQKTSDGEEIACKHTSTYIDTGDNCNLKCTACGYTVEEGRHESIKEDVEIPPTENAHGSMTRTCESCGWKETVTIPPLGNSGSDGETGTFDVANADQFVSLINRINSGEVANNVTINITGDIDMIGVSFTPIKEFRGVIEGNGWCIMNVELTANGEYVNVTDGNGTTYNSMMVGIISKAYGVSVRSLNLDNINANITTSGNMYIGALAGYADGLVVEDCTVSSILVLNETSNPGSTGVAGLVGYSRDALVQGVTLSARIDHTARSGESHTGAVLGAGNVRIHDCTIDLEITFVEESGAGHVGWLAGREYTDLDVDVSTLQGSTVTGTFSAKTNWYAWGAVGQGYFYLEHGGAAMDLEQYNTRIDVRVIG